MRAIKVRAARENRRLKDLVAELLRRGLAQHEGSIATGSSRVELPLVHTAHAADPDDEVTPERVAEILLGQESDSAAPGS